MSDTTPSTPLALPDRLSVDPRSKFFQREII